MHFLRFLSKVFISKRVFASFYSFCGIINCQSVTNVVESSLSERKKGKKKRGMGCLMHLIDY